MNTRKLGADKEETAVKFLEKQGMRIVGRNFRIRQGEIDIIGYHDNYLVFVEVKFRSTGKQGNATEAVNLRKQQKICRVADYYRYRNRIPETVGVRYDVIAIQGEEIRWIRNAFPHSYSY